MRRVRRELTEHVGGKPTAIQRALIERCCILSLRVAQMDAQFLEGKTPTLHDTNFSLAWSNALRRTLVALGVNGHAAKPMDAIELARLKYGPPAA
jgi:hypothetical protein